ncbi:MAG: AEC family transporter [Clostridia bacterium]|nr:AEC family transporter [Clostridia bacterium]
MESLKLSFNAVLPIFILMLLGYFLKKIKITDKKGFDTINKLVFKVFLPILLFYNIYQSDIQSVFDIKLICFTIAGILVIFALGYFAVMIFTEDNNKRGVMLQGFFRSNFALLGLPLIGYIYGENSGGLPSLMLAIVIPLFNILAVITLERFCGGRNELKFLQLLKSIIKNPLIIGCLIGMFFC